MKKILLGLSLLSLFSLPFVKAETYTEAVLPGKCQALLEKGAKRVKVNAFYGKEGSYYYIAGYQGADGESGGQTLFSLNKIVCEKIATDNSVFPLGQWIVGRGGRLTADVVQGLALDDAKRSLKENPVKQMSSEYLAPEQVAAYRSLGVKVQ
jgi:hypothetical protein